MKAERSSAVPGGEAHEVAAPAPEERVFIDIPIYVGGVWHSYRGWGDGYYLNHGGSSTAWRENRELRDAVYDLEDAFRHEDISLLAPLTDPDARIAVFAKGEYDYSLEANDYLDMTRDFMRASETTGFDILRVQRRASDVYQVFAKHIYRNGDGREESVYLTVVLERVHAHWTITQIDTSPERVED